MRELTRDILAERSIMKTYRKTIWYNFISAIKEYQLIEENDKIMVCMSGGKDSFLLAICFKILQRISEFKFDVEYVVMNPGYNQKNLKLIKSNLKLLNIPATIFNSDIFESVSNVEENPCYLCARMRRGYLYHYAKKIGCNKIALGHHQDDVMETFMMSLLYNGTLKTMMPKLHSDNVEGMELIRPLYLVREKDIINWSNYNELQFLRCACKLTEKRDNPNYEFESKRFEAKQIIKYLGEKNKIFEHNIFKASENVNLDKLIKWKYKNVHHSFLDDYKKEEI